MRGEKGYRKRRDRSVAGSRTNSSSQKSKRAEPLASGSSNALAFQPRVNLLVDHAEPKTWKADWMTRPLRTVRLIAARWAVQGMGVAAVIVVYGIVQLISPKTLPRDRVSAVPPQVSNGSPTPWQLADRILITNSYELVLRDFTLDADLPPIRELVVKAEAARWLAPDGNQPKNVVLEIQPGTNVSLIEALEKGTPPNAYTVFFVESVGGEAGAPARFMLRSAEMGGKLAYTHVGQTDLEGVTDLARSKWTGTPAGTSESESAGLQASATRL
jgi:hypothetical protein